MFVADGNQVAEKIWLLPLYTLLFESDGIELPSDFLFYKSNGNVHIIFLPLELSF